MEPTKKEFALYFDLVQHGYYTPEFLQRLYEALMPPGQKVPGAGDRVQAFAILATLEKNRHRLGEARVFAESGLDLTRNTQSPASGLNEWEIYLLDQLGGISLMQGKLAEAGTFFEEEIALLQGYTLWGYAQQAHSHLVGAYRGLAAVFGAMGKSQEAQEATAQSLKYAQLSDNKEGEALAALQRYEQSAEQSGAIPDPSILENIPLEHIIGQVMALNLRARVLLTHGQTSEGERLLRRAFREAGRHEFGGEIETARATAARFGINLQ